MAPILPITYFGNLEYFYYLVKHRLVYIDTTETYLKQTFRNRCVIVGPNGTLNLSVPVERPQGQHTKTQSVSINYQENWQKNHLKTLKSCYNRSPYFEFYIDQLEDLFLKPYPLLSDLNLKLLYFLIDKLGIDTEVILNPATLPDDTLDLRPHFSPKTASHFISFPYLQTFIERHGHVPNLSILDLLFNEGPNAICILEESRIKH